MCKVKITEGCGIRLESKPISYSWFPFRRDRKVESRLGAVASMLRFPTPLIEPDVPITGIRLPDWIHPKAHGSGPR